MALAVFSASMGRVTAPRARGLQGIEPTPKCFHIMEEIYHYRSAGERIQRDYLESRHHLALFFAVDEIVVVLHRNEGCEVVCDSVV